MHVPAGHRHFQHGHSQQLSVPKRHREADNTLSSALMRDLREADPGDRKHLITPLIGTGTTRLMPRTGFLASRLFEALCPSDLGPSFNPALQGAVRLFLSARVTLRNLQSQVETKQPLCVDMFRELIFPDADSGRPGTRALGRPVQTSPPPTVHLRKNTH